MNDVQKMKFIHSFIIWNGYNFSKRINAVEFTFQGHSIYIQLTMFTNKKEKKKNKTETIISKVWKVKCFVTLEFIVSYRNCIQYEKQWKKANGANSKQTLILSKLNPM